MAKRKKPEFKAGKRLSAAALNILAEAAEAVENLRGDPPIDVVHLPGGILIRRVDTLKIYAKITSGTNPYAWSEVIPATGGTFTTPSWGLSGTTTVDPAYEQTGNAAVAANTIVKMERAKETGEWLFHFAAC